MQSRLVRVLLIFFAGVVLVLGFKALAGYKADNGESILSPIGKTLDKAGEKVLGTALKVLPNPPVFEEENQTDPQDEVSQEEAEPIEEPVKNIEKKTEILIKEIKELPQDQLEAIKKQVYKEMCETLKTEE